jgi:hypothetical protein
MYIPIQKIGIFCLKKVTMKTIKEISTLSGYFDCPEPFASIESDQMDLHEVYHIPWRMPANE